MQEGVLWMLLSCNMVESIYENDCLTASGLPIFVQALELLMEALQQMGVVKSTGTLPNAVSSSFKRKRHVVQEVLRFTTQ
jgi:hypothetical protein